MCIICKKKVCWSTNDNTEERIAALLNSRQVRHFFTVITEEDGDEDPGEDNANNEQEYLADDMKELAAHNIQVYVEDDYATM